MPINPDFIPVSKGNQLLFVSSWRDVGSPTPPLSSSSSRAGAAHSHHTHPSGGGTGGGQSSHTTTPKISPSLSVLRMKEGNGANGSGRHAVLLPPPPSVKLPPSSTTPASTVTKKGSGRRRRDRRGGAAVTQAAAAAAAEECGESPPPSTSATEKTPPSSVTPPNGVDYFLYLSIPTAPIPVVDTADLPPRPTTPSSSSQPPHTPSSTAATTPEAHAAVTSSSSSLPGLSSSSLSVDATPQTSVIQNGITTLMDVKPLVSPEELVLEIKSQSNPLRVFLLGPPRMIYAKKVEPVPPTRAAGESEGATPTAAAVTKNGPADPTPSTTTTTLEKDTNAFLPPSSSTVPPMPLFRTPALEVLPGGSTGTPPSPTTLPSPAIPTHVDCAVPEGVKEGGEPQRWSSRKETVAVTADETLPADAKDAEVSMKMNESISPPFFSLAHPGESFSAGDEKAGIRLRSPAPVSGASEGTTTPSDGSSLPLPPPPPPPSSAPSFHSTPSLSVPPPSISTHTTSVSGTSLLSTTPHSQLVVLPPGIPQDFQVVTLFAEESEALHLQAFLNQRFRSIKTQLVPRSRSVLNASLVLKGLPSLHKSETILAELQQQLCHVPSYVRLHRSERGVFKNVMFIKYHNRGIAEDCKLILERFYLGARPLKVEFKKKSKPESALPLGAGNGNGNGKTSTTSTPRTQPGTTPHESGTGGKSATPPTPSAAALPPTTSSAAAEASDTPYLLEKLIRELRVSTENEGVRLRRHDLRKKDLRVLKQLCQYYGMRLDLHTSDTVITVMRDTSLRRSHFSVSNLTGNGSGTYGGGNPSTTHPFPLSSSVELGLSPTALSFSTSARFSFQHSSNSSNSTTPRSVPTSTSALGHNSLSASSRGAAAAGITVPSTAGGKSPQLSATDGPLSTGVKPWRASTQHQDGSATEAGGSHSGRGGEDSAASLSALSPGERLRKIGLSSILRCPGEEGGGIPFPPGRGRPV